MRPITRLCSLIVAVMVVRSSTDRGVGATAVVVAQSPAPAFEVASVKRSPPDARGSMVSGATPGGFTARNVSLERLILYAYAVNQYQLAEDPDWIRTERFDIAGRYPDGWMPGEVSSMVRQLLADRFQLKTHPDSRAVDGYALRLAQATGRLGPRLQSSSTDCAALIAANGPSVVKDLDDKPVCIGVMTGEAIRVGTRPITTLVSLLSSILQQPVTDATGLTGNFDFELDWSPELTATLGTAAAANDKPSLFTALQEQLGLKLERIRTDAPVIVIDHVERPSEN